MGSRRPGAGILPVVEQGSRQVAVEGSRRGLVPQEEPGHNRRELVDRILQEEADRSLGTPYLLPSLIFFKDFLNTA